MLIFWYNIGEGGLEMFCQNCGAEVPDRAVVCLKCGAAAPNGGVAVKSSGTNDEWMVAMLLAMFLGPFGAHNFYLKRNSIAIAQLILGICSCFVISGIWGFVDWIMILSGNYRKADGTILKKTNNISDEQGGNKMYCRTCGKEVAENAVACMSCGCDPRKGDKFCPNCGAEVSAAQVVCVKCGVALRQTAAAGGCNGKKDKTVAALLAIFLGALGIHEFYLGNTTSAVIRLVITVVSCGWGGFVLGVISLIEGIVYLTKSDEEFQSVYVEGHKAWF